MFITVYINEGTITALDIAFTRAEAESFKASYLADYPDDEPVVAILASID